MQHEQQKLQISTPPDRSKISELEDLRYDDDSLIIYSWKIKEIKQKLIGIYSEGTRRDTLVSHLPGVGAVPDGEAATRRLGLHPLLT